MNSPQVDFALLAAEMRELDDALDRKDEKKMRDVMTREDLDKLARLYANKSRDELSQMTVSYEAVHALAQEYLRQRNHQCQVCHHRWEGPCIGTYCGDCHRAAREATLKSEQTQKSLDALQKLYDDLVWEDEQGV